MKQMDTRDKCETRGERAGVNTSPQIKETLAMEQEKLRECIQAACGAATVAFPTKPTEH
jgi:hypothetical protein